MCSRALKKTNAAFASRDSMQIIGGMSSTTDLKARLVLARQGSSQDIIGSLTLGPISITRALTVINIRNVQLFHWLTKPREHWIIMVKYLDEDPLILDPGGPSQPSRSHSLYTAMCLWELPLLVERPLGA